MGADDLMTDESKKATTTPEHFEVFKAEFLRWVEVFGLKNWEIFFEHEDPPEEGRAYIVYDITYHVATVYLSKTWHNFDSPIDDNYVKKSAFHEACELLFGRLNILARGRYLSEGEVTEAIHSIIRVLENVLFWRQE